MAQINTMLTMMKDLGGSDLHLSVGNHPRIRKSGSLQDLEGYGVLTEPDMQALLMEIAPPAGWNGFQDSPDLDFAHAIPGVARFRANYFRQHFGLGAVFRIIPEKILPLEALSLPPAVERMAELDGGLVLVTGPTGSGKSTTLAAIIDRINKTKIRHIVTIEDPVEFVHPNVRSVFSHREAGRHAKTFERALKAVIRQDADVILVGEMRDAETIDLALVAAQMGKLVFGTLHTNSASKTIDRLVDAFPSDEQDRVRLGLSETLYGVVSQLLLKTPDGGRCAVNEILVRTSALANLIRDGNTPMIASAIQSGKALGMQSMDDALWNALQEGRITPTDAFMKAKEKARFERFLPKDDG